MSFQVYFFRRGFYEFGQRTLDIVQEMEHAGIIFYADMDNLKIINDSYGHDAGDEAIRLLAEIFKKYSEQSAFELYAALQENFGKDLGEYDVLIPALCAVLVQQQQIATAKVNQVKEYSAQAAQRIAELENEIRSRNR